MVQCLNKHRRSFETAADLDIEISDSETPVIGIDEKTLKQPLFKVKNGLKKKSCKQLSNLKIVHL